MGHLIKFLKFWGENCARCSLNIPFNQKSCTKLNLRWKLFFENLAPTLLVNKSISSPCLAQIKKMDGELFYFTSTWQKWYFWSSYNNRKWEKNASHNFIFFACIAHSYKRPYLGMKGNKMGVTGCRMYSKCKFDTLPHATDTLPSRYHAATNKNDTLPHATNFF